METYIPINITEIKEAEELPSKTYKLDLDAGRIVGYVDGLEAVQQAIRKAIVTPRWKCLIYDNQYGSEVEDAVIANDASRAYAIAAVEGFVKDCMKPDSRVLDMYDFEFEFQGDDMYVSFTADTIYGPVQIEEVL